MLMSRANRCQLHTFAAKMEFFQLLLDIFSSKSNYNLINNCAYAKNSTLSMFKQPSFAPSLFQPLSVQFHFSRPPPTQPSANGALITFPLKKRAIQLKSGGSIPRQPVRAVARRSGGAKPRALSIYSSPLAR